MAYVTGETAAAATGKTIAEIDEAAATGVVDAKYVGWQLRVDVPVDLEYPEHPDGLPEPEPEPKKPPRKKALSCRVNSYSCAYWI